MPRPPTINDNKAFKFVCAQLECNRKFRSNAGRTRHINAKHGGLGLQMNYPQSEEADHFSDLSSHPGFPSPSPTLSENFDPPSPNLDAFDFGTGSEELNPANHDDNTDNTSPPQPSQDTVQASTSMEYHPYLNGKMNNL
jgi:hypothetical protein